MPWKFVCDLWFHEDFTNNNLQDDNKMCIFSRPYCSNIRYIDVSYPVKECAAYVPSHTHTIFPT